MFKLIKKELETDALARVEDLIDQVSPVEFTHLQYETRDKLFEGDITKPNSYFTYLGYINAIKENIDKLQFVDGFAVYHLIKVKMIEVKMPYDMALIKLKEDLVQCNDRLTRTVDLLMAYETRLSALERKSYSNSDKSFELKRLDESDKDYKPRLEKLEKMITGELPIIQHTIPNFTTYNELKTLIDYKYFDAFENPNKYLNFIKIKQNYASVQFKEKFNNLIVLPCYKHEDGSDYFGNLGFFNLILYRYKPQEQDSNPYYYFKCQCHQPCNQDFTCMRCEYTIPFKYIIEKFNKDSDSKYPLSHVQRHYIIRYITGWFYLNWRLYTKYGILIEITLDTNISITISKTLMKRNHTNEKYMLIYPFENMHISIINQFPRQNFKHWMEQI